MNKILRLQRSESFYIRDGWFEKLFLAEKENSLKEAFSKAHGTEILGIGSNMVKSLQYWGEACRLIEKEGITYKLTTLGTLISRKDPFLETMFSWGLIHYSLVTNYEDAPVIYKIFNSPTVRQISRKETCDYLKNAFQEDGISGLNEASIQKDLAVFISSYTIDNSFDDRTPEQNITCPLSKIQLIDKIGADMYEKHFPDYLSVDYRMLFICLKKYYKNNSFNIDDAVYSSESPCLAFNIDRSVFFGYLTEMNKKGLIRLERTAGLNTAYFQDNRPDDELFEDYLLERKVKNLK